MKTRIRLYVSITLLFLLCAAKSQATHIYGADLYYTHVSGNTYNVTLVIYGDCQAAASLISALTTATPEIRVFNGTSLFKTFTLTPISVAAGQGIEVTPVCPSQASQTACKTPAGPIAGVRKYTYTGTVDLGSTSANWIFNFDGTLGGPVVTGAGRSSTITNVASASTLTLNATLNNTSSSNSSPVYTTIPTPFFCLNKLANYNPGAVDANGDSLSFALVDAVNTDAAGVASLVTYVTGFSGANPLAASSVLLNNTNGQYSFIPTAIQRSLVVYTVSEYRNGVLVGTSQREMTYVIINCNNDPPRGVITNPSSSDVTVKDSTDVTACTLTGPFTFQINPTSATSNNITVSYAGLPPGATFTVAGNATPTPHSVFSWNTAGVLPGKYSFFVTYQDDGCPLSSKQTFTYSITIFGNPSVNVSQITQASCSKRAQILITPGGGGPYTVKVLVGVATYQTNTNVTAPFTDSLFPGTYVVRVLNSANCFVDDTVVIASPIAMAFTSISVSNVNCFGAADGLISVGVTGGSAPYQYEVNTLGFGAASSIGNLDTGTYFVHVKDANGCSLDTGAFLITGPTQIAVTAGIVNSICHALSNGQASVTASGGSPGYAYSINGGAFGAANTFSSLPGGTYVIHTRDSHGCVKDTSITIVDSLNVAGLFTIITPKCFGQTNGSITATGTNGTGPYSYAFGTGTFSTVDNLPNLSSGSYAVHIKDALGCTSDNSVFVNQPAQLVPHATITTPSCIGGSNGTITISGTGGTPTYHFALNGPFSSGTFYNGLTAGIYTIKIEDANGCTANAVVTVGQPTALLIDSLIATNIVCYGSGDGSVITGASGGSSPYMFSANSGAFQSSHLLTGLPAGLNTIHVKDNNGCIHDTTVVLNQPEPLIFNVDTVINPTCEGFKDGKVVLGASGGNPGYTFAINDTSRFSAVSTFSQLGQGVYNFFVKDSHSCTYDTSLTLTGLPPIVIDNISTTNIPCYSGTDGMIIISAHGGVQPFNYTLPGISGPSKSDTFAHLTANTYAITITDSKTCQKDTSATIVQPDQIIVSAKVTPNECIGLENQGIVDALVSGGTGPYYYKWSTPDSAVTESISGLANGSYRVRIHDNNNCGDSAVGLVTYDDCCKPFLPNAFTPNADGKDDVFRLRYKGDLKLEEFWIYDRYGQRVYISNEIDKGWDGTYKGVPLRMDTYFYYLKALCGNKGDHEVTLKGDVTLIR